MGWVASGHCCGYPVFDSQLGLVVPVFWGCTRLLGVLWAVAPALSYWSKSLKNSRDQGFECVALVLSYFRNAYFMRCLLPLWCSLLLAGRGFLSISRFSLGTKYILFCMDTASRKLWYLCEKQVNCIRCASCKVQLYSYCTGAAPRAGRWVEACSWLSLGGRCTLPGLCPCCPYLSSLHYLSA